MKTLESPLRLNVTNRLVLAINLSSFVSGVHSRTLFNCFGVEGEGKFKYRTARPSTDHGAGPKLPGASRSFRFCAPSKFTSHSSSAPRRYSMPARLGRGKGSEIESLDSA